MTPSLDREEPRWRVKKKKKKVAAVLRQAEVHKSTPFFFFFFMTNTRGQSCRCFISCFKLCSLRVASLLQHRCCELGQVISV